MREPLRALLELRRVLRPGGVVAVRDPDSGTEVRVPATPALEQFTTLVLRFAEHNGASPRYARHQRSLLLDAGICRAEAGAIAVVAGTPRATRRVAELKLGWFRNPAFVGTVTGQGWADQPALERLRAEVEAWGERPDAFCAGLDCTAIGWVAD